MEPELRKAARVISTGCDWVLIVGNLMELGEQNMMWVAIPLVMAIKNQDKLDIYCLIPNCYLLSLNGYIIYK